MLVKEPRGGQVAGSEKCVASCHESISLRKLEMRLFRRVFRDPPCCSRGSGFSGRWTRCIRLFGPNGLGQAGRLHIAAVSVGDARRHAGDRGLDMAVPPFYFEKHNKKRKKKHQKKKPKQEPTPPTGKNSGA